MTGAYVTVIGIGNTLMGDDGVGVRIAEKLAETDLGDDVEVVMGAVAGMQLLGHVRSSPHVIFLDAIDAGAAPGSVFRFSPDEAGITKLRSNTTHGMSVGYLITSARFCGDRPDAIVYAVQIGDVRPNPDTLTPEVTAAAAEVLPMVAEEVAALLAARDRAGDATGAR